MKKIIRCLAMTLALALAATSLVACGDNEESSILDPGNYSEVVAATYGDQEIMMDEVNFFLRYQQVQMEGYYWSLYTQYGYPTVWDAPYDEYKTMGTFVKELTMQQAIQTRVLIDHAADYGLSEADVNKESCAEKAKQMIDELDEEFFQYSNVTVEQLTAWLEQNELAYQVYEKVVDAAEVEVSAEETEMYSYQYVKFVDDEEEETSPAAEGETEETEAVDTRTSEEKANEVYEKINGDEEFDVYASENNYTLEDGSSLKVLGEDDEETEMYKQTHEMKKGEVKKFYIEDEKAWYVVQCKEENDEDATASKAEEVTEAKKEEAFNELYKKWDEEAPEVDIKDAWENLVLSTGERLIPEKEETETEPVEEQETEAATGSQAEVTEEETTAAETKEN